MLAAFVSSKIALGCSALLSPLGFDSVVEDFSEEPVVELCVDSPEPVEVPVPVPVPDDFGVDVVEGIFGGVPVEGNSGLFAPVPPFGAFGTGIFGVLAVPGVTGMLVVGVLVVGVVGIGACATVSVGGACVLCLLSAAAPAAAAAPVSSTATSASVPSGRQFGRSLPRLPGWPAPHCKHHS